jgi:hypothetical protein
MESFEFPRPCFAAGGTGDSKCRILRYLSNYMNGDTYFDIGRGLGGNGMTGTINMYPFKFRYPGVKSPTFADGVQLIAQIPLTNDLPGSSTSGVIMSAKGFCISKMADSLGKGDSSGGTVAQMKLITTMMSLTGTDLCIETPGASVSTKELKFGLKISGYALDKTKVDIAPLWDLFPDSLGTLKDTMKKAFAYEVRLYTQCHLVLGSKRVKLPLQPAPYSNGKK